MRTEFSLKDFDLVRTNQLNLGKGLFAGVSLHGIVFTAVILFQPADVKIEKLGFHQVIPTHWLPPLEPVLQKGNKSVGIDDNEKQGRVEPVEFIRDPAGITVENTFSMFMLDSINGRQSIGLIPVAIEPAEVPRDTFTIVEFPPIVIRQPKAVYPDLLAKTGQEGRVFVRVLVNEDGAVTYAEFSSGDIIFYESAKDAVTKTMFRPAINGGIAVKVWVTIPFTFRLK